MSSIKSLVIIASMLYASSPVLLQGASATTLLKNTAFNIPSARSLATGTALLGLGYGVYHYVIKPLRQLCTIMESLNSLQGKALKPNSFVRSPVDRKEFLEQIQSSADEIDKISKEFLDRIQPNQELARPGIQSNDNDDSVKTWRLWHQNPALSETQRKRDPKNRNDNQFACLLTGHKDVFYPDKNYAPFTPLILQALMHKHSITRVSFTKEGYVNTLYFSKRGTTNALLFIKYWATEELPHSYLNGLLLGYSPQDLVAFDIHLNSLHPNNPPLDPEELKAQQKSAHDWIADNSPTIEQWIRDNIEKSNITFS